MSEDEQTKILNIDYWELYQQNKITNATFEVKDDNGATRKFHVHKHVLSSISDVFNAMFFGPKSETNEHFFIQDITDSAFELLITYAYKKEIVFQDIGVASKIAYAAKKYKIRKLLDEALAYIIDNLNYENACLIIENNYILDSSLNDSAFKMIEDNVESVIKSETYFALSPKCMLFLMEHIYRRVEPVKMFALAHGWATNACLVDKVDMNVVNVRARIEAFLPFIHFLKLTPRDFAHIVLPTSIMSPEESGYIGRNLDNKDGISKGPLPPWCSRTINIKSSCTVGNFSTPAQDEKVACCLFSVSENAKLESFGIDLRVTSELDSALRVELVSLKDSGLQRDLIYIDRQRFERKIMDKKYIFVCSIPSGLSLSNFAINANEIYQLQVHIMSDVSGIFTSKPIENVNEKLDFPCKKSPGKSFKVKLYPRTGYARIYNMKFSYQHQGFLG